MIIVPVLVAVFALAASALMAPVKRQPNANYAAIENKKTNEETLWAPGTWTPITTFTGVLAIVAVGQALLFLRQLRLIREGAQDAKMAAVAAERAANTAIEQTSLAKIEFVANQRPWCSVELAAMSDMRGLHKGGFSVEVDVVVRNHGRTPALGVHHQLEVIPYDVTLIKQRQDIIEKRMTERRQKNALTGQVIFPSLEKRRHDQLNSFPNEAADSEEIATDRPDPNKSFIRAYVVGCLDYSFAFGGQGITRLALPVFQGGGEP